MCREGPSLVYCENELYANHNNSFERDGPSSSFEEDQLVVRRSTRRGLLSKSISREGQRLRNIENANLKVSRPRDTFQFTKQNICDTIC